MLIYDVGVQNLRHFQRLYALTSQIWCWDAGPWKSKDFLEIVGPGGDFLVLRPTISGKFPAVDAPAVVSGTGRHVYGNP